MATFEQEVEAWEKKMMDQASKVVRKTVIDLHTRIVRRTPVETGRLKANNQIGIGVKPATATMDTDKTKLGTSGSTVAKETSKLRDLPLGVDVWICNNVEYALPIEMGHSKTGAPQGMFRISMQDLMQKWPSLVSGTINGFDTEGGE